MRYFVYNMLIFLILFNIMLVVFAQFFPGAEYLKKGNDAIEELRTTRHGSFEGVGDATAVITRMFLTWETLAIFGAILGLTGFMAKLSGGTINVALLLGIGMLIATITVLWNAAVTTFTNLNYTNNAEVTILFTVCNICIGIILMWTVVDFLTGQQGVAE